MQNEKKEEHYEKKRNPIVEVVVDGETYWIDNGKVMDENYMLLPERQSRYVAAHYYGSLPYKTYSVEQGKKLILDAKTAYAYDVAYKIITYFFEERALTVSETKSMLSLYTSLCRTMGKSEEAITLAESFAKQSEEYLSIPLLTSLAAAYCDVGNYEKAFRVCNYAYARQGGGQGYKTELSLVYMRIKKESGLTHL